MMTRKKLLIDWNLLEMMLLLMVQVLPLRQFCILKTFKQLPMGGKLTLDEKDQEQ